MSAPALCPTDIPLPPARRAPLAPLPPAMWTRSRHAMASPILWRWIALSVALHVLAILLFGSPAGGNKEGRAMWGRLSVVIKEGWRDTGPDLRMERELAPIPAAPAPQPSLRREPRRAPAQLATPAPAPTPGIETPVPPLLERLPSTEPKAEMAPAPKAPPPIEIPPAPVAPPTIERMTAPRVERQLVDAPPTPPATLERLNAPRIERQLAEPPAMPAPPAIAAPREVTPSPAAARPAETPAPAPRSTPVDPLPGPLPKESGNVPSPSRDRDADSPLRKAPEPSSTYDPTAAPPAMDLDAMRRRAGELGRSGTGNRAALPFPMPPVPEKKSKMEELIDKARKPDCRDAYKHLGLAAVVPLIANEFGEGKCKW